ncbi:O-antigen ligase-like membrane protein [Plasticicumulans lactativorans]|uniref:O-antigen ligase-like membrane protein n=2 Tax=Plasticicumulans lactativorans TaxID=1133106 RepID=A0A4R2L506_9GAMM|nr:O-antigen ligase-like membrane protein [Plasticicumulans lactativorans]
MASRSSLYIAIGLATLAAILAVHAGEGMRYVVLAVTVALAAWSLRQPAVGLVAALPLMYMINPTPTTVGWREFGFAITITVAGLSSIWRHRSMLAGLPRAGCIWLSIVTGWFVLNFFTAFWNGVSVADWVRGAAPFVFMSYFLPIWLEARANRVFAHGWQWAAGIAAALFSWHVVQVYVGEQLWRPATYIFDNGTWISMGYAEAQALGKQVFEFAIRVTQRLQQATDTLLCLGVVWGAWASLWLSNWLLRMLGLGLSILATTAIVLTYTRSMLLSSFLVALVLMLVAIRRGGAKRVVVLFLALVATGAGTITGFNLEAIYLNRLVQMQEQASVSFDASPNQGKEGMAASSVDGSIASLRAPTPLQSAMPGKMEGQPKDANIASRMEEYRIAWDHFRASPLVGHGLGVQHNIRFDAGNGEWLDTRVGYVHNWVMYVLMTGGLLGLGVYAAVLFGPAVLAWRRCPRESGLPELTFATVAVMAVYGLFFAVFRLIPFNLVLGGMWGLLLGVQREHARG